MKKVLIITYYWPPAGGSGVQRWLKFTKYLPKYNWQPIIYTPKNPYFEVQDEALLNDIPSEAEIWKTSIWEPYSLKDKLFGKGGKSQSAGVIANKKSLKNKALNWVRGNVFIPDPKVYWVKPSVNVLLEKIKNEGIEHIITTGPPHSMHLIGLGLKKAMPNLKWIADFRDPWSELDLLDEFHLSNSSRKKHKDLEREVLKTADVTLTVSETWVEDLKRLGGKRVELITNGYDADDFELKPKTNDKFVIGHYGLLNHLRNPKNLWKALADLCNENTEFNAKLEIHLSGNIDGEVLTEIESYSSLKGKVKNLGYLSHAQVLQQYNEADLLLLLLFNSKSGVGNYPGKIFEYFAAEKPIIAFGPEGSDVENLLFDYYRGVCPRYDTSVKDIKFHVLTYYKMRNSIMFIKDASKFSREKLTHDLANLLNTLS
ncbi:MAG: glycosyl transferase family 1 [Flavobacteriales bacterium]|nr:glycosyl transferase family 1 [Flavobacteriales bacterium]|tara:strand:+ start:5158 stop:6441 length:1284 start_codon:yes stop_codon:yes gene_type:complete